jgi:hypothetical protein
MSTSLFWKSFFAGITAVAPCVIIQNILLRDLDSQLNPVRFVVILGCDPADLRAISGESGNTAITQ